MDEKRLTVKKRTSRNDAVHNECWVEDIFISNLALFNSMKARLRD